MIIGIFGRTGTGKTTLLKRIARQADRAIIVDPNNKLGHLGVCVRSVAEFKGYWRRQFDERWRIVLQPSKIDPDKRPRDVLAPFVMLAFSVARGGCPQFWVIVDEVDTFGSAGSPDNNLRAVVDRGRNFGISFAFAARRPACVDRTLTSQCSTVYLFQAQEKVDIVYFREVCGDEVASRLPNLSPFFAVRKAGKEIELVAISPEGVEAAPAKPHSAPETAEQGAPRPVVGGQCAHSAIPAGAQNADPMPAMPEGPKMVLTLAELAAAFGYADPHKFRLAVLDTGRVWHRRISRSRIEVLASDIPGGSNASRA